MTEWVRRVALATGLGAGALLGATGARAQTETDDRRAHLQVTASGGLLVGRQRGFVPGLALRFFTSRGHGVMARFERATLETPTYTTSCGGCVETTFTLFDINEERLGTIEKVRAFQLLHEPWTSENGLLTPTLKLRRELLAKQFAEAIEKMFK